jgi:hypothetical protein
MRISFAIATDTETRELVFMPSWPKELSPKHRTCKRILSVKIILGYFDFFLLWRPENWIEMEEAK